MKTQFCKSPEFIENYDLAAADNFVGWDIHHRLETHNSDGERRSVDLTKAELKALGTYYNRPAEELIFIRHSEHTVLHMKGKHISEETKRKISEAHKNLPKEIKMKTAENRKGKKLSEEWKRNIGKAMKGIKFSEERNKKIAEANQRYLASYKEYKLNGGTLKWNEFRKNYKNLIGENRYGKQEFGTTQYNRRCLFGWL